MTILYWICWCFILAGILCALCSEKLDQVFHGEQKLKKVILVFSAGVVLVCAIPMAMRFLSS